MENNINYQNFNYNLYLLLNKDVIINSTLENVDHEEIKLGAWKHYINHGIIEERPTNILNTTKTHNGRFGNLFFINMACHFIALKFNLNVNYKYFEKFKKLGVKLFTGLIKYNDELYYELTDDSFLDIINFSKISKNLMITNNIWCQQDDFIELLKNYWMCKFNKNSIIKNNLFNKRYNNNNDLFIHVRLGDITDKTISLENYYLNTISFLQWDNGYISSDSLNHPICINLINKFNLNPIYYDEVETIMFGSTCKKIVLSGGTFSWLIGFYSFFSEIIIYPKIQNPWYGKIFDNMGWKIIET
jgi:hypothetical protein